MVDYLPWGGRERPRGKLHRGVWYIASPRGETIVRLWYECHDMISGKMCRTRSVPGGDGVIELKIKLQTRKGFLIKVTTGHQTDTDRRLMAPRRGSFTRAGGKGKEAVLRYSCVLIVGGYDPLFVSAALEIIGWMAAAWIAAGWRMLPKLAKPAARRGRCRIRDRSVTWRRRRKEM